MYFQLIQQREKVQTKRMYNCIIFNQQQTNKKLQSFQKNWQFRNFKPKRKIMINKGQIFVFGRSKD